MPNALGDEELLEVDGGSVMTKPMSVIKYYCDNCHREVLFPSSSKCCPDCGAEMKTIITSRKLF